MCYEHRPGPLYQQFNTWMVGRSSWLVHHVRQWGATGHIGVSVCVPVMLSSKLRQVSVVKCLEWVEFHRSGTHTGHVAALRQPINKTCTPAGCSGNLTTLSAIWCVPLRSWFPDSHTPPTRI